MFYVADPNLWVPFDDGTRFGQWLDDDRTNADLTALGVSDKDIARATGPTRTSSTRSAAGCGPASATPGSASRPSRAEIEELLQNDQTMIDIVFEATHRRRPRRPHDRPAAQGRAVRSGDHRRLGRAAGTRAPPRSSSCTSRATSRARARCGATSAAAWGWSASRSRRRPRRPAPTLATGVPVGEILPGEGVVLEDGTLHQRRTVICNADPKRLLGLVQELPTEYQQRLRDWKIRSPVVKFNASLTRLPSWTAAPGEDFPARASVDVTTGLDDAQRAFERCTRGEAGGRLRRDLRPDRLRPHARPARQAPDERLRPVRAV